MRGTSTGQRWAWRLLAVPAFGLVYLLTSGNPAGASTFVAPGANFPERVTVWRPFTGQLGVGNFSTPPESSSGPVSVSQIDLVPACANGSLDCQGGVEAGAFSVAATASGSSGPASCRGTWTVSEITPGVFRFVPPGGEASLQLAVGETCVVDYSATALRVPTTDVSASTGGQTNQVVSATAQATGAAPVRLATPDQTTVDPAPKRATPVPDYDGDGQADIIIFRPSEGSWYVRQSSGGGVGLTWGGPGDVPVLGDYDGDGKADPAVFRTADGMGMWLVKGSAAGQITKNWGAPGDIPVPGDYDGDGRTDFAVFRPGLGAATWFVSGSTGATITQGWGTIGDLPVAGDYDGDGRTDFGVFRPALGAWFVRQATGATFSESWGTLGDVPVPADYDGDGKTDVAVFRPALGTWMAHQSSGQVVSQAWGVTGDVPVPADYDGDAKADIGVVRPSEGMWYLRTVVGTTSQVWGGATDVPVVVPPGLRLP